MRWIPWTKICSEREAVNLSSYSWVVLELHLHAVKYTSNVIFSSISRSRNVLWCTVPPQQSWRCVAHICVVRRSAYSRLRLKRDGTRAETIFRLSAKRTSPFKSEGASVQSTTGSRGVRISGSNVGHNMFRGSVKSTGYYSIRQFPLYFPSRSSPCESHFKRSPALSLT